jgi:hypothetical protein
MSESMQRDDHRSSFHDMVHFRYDEHRPALHAEGLTTTLKLQFVQYSIMVSGFVVHVLFIFNYA